MLLARRLVNGRERGCLQVVSCSVLRLVNMSTRAMRLKTQARALACLQVVYLTFPVVKEQSLSASLVRLEKELFPLYLATCFASGLRPADISRAPFTPAVKITPGPQTCSRAPVGSPASPLRSDHRSSRRLPCGRKMHAAETPPPLPRNNSIRRYADSNRHYSILPL